MAGFKLDPERDPWERQPGESPDQYEWWLHWRNAGERRTYAATAARFGIRPARVQATAGRNSWRERLRLWKADNTRSVQVMFAERLEDMLLSWADGAGRMIEHANEGDLENVPPDRALNAATNMLKLARDADMMKLIEPDVGSGTSTATFDALMKALDPFPDAKRAVLDAWREQRDRENDS